MRRYDILVAELWDSHSCLLDRKYLLMSLKRRKPTRSLVSSLPPRTNIAKDAWRAFQVRREARTFIVVKFRGNFIYLSDPQGEKFSETKKRLQTRIGASDKDLAKCRFALIQVATFKQPSYIEGRSDSRQNCIDLC